MTDNDLFEDIQHIVNHPNVDANHFKGHTVETAAYAMGVSSSDPYSNYWKEMKPWSRPLQIGKLMRKFYDAPSPISVAIALATLDRVSPTPNLQLNNILLGFGHVMSDYAFRILKRNVEDGIEDQTSRTYHVLKNILQMAEIRRVLTTPNMSMDLDSIQYSLGYANTALIGQVDGPNGAHPVAIEMLRRFIEEVQRLIQPKVRSDAA